MRLRKTLQTLNQRVVGSNPTAPTNQIKDLAPQKICGTHLPWICGTLAERGEFAGWPLIAFRKRTAAWNLAFQARSLSVDKLDLAPSLTGATKEPSLGDSRIPLLS